MPVTATPLSLKTIEKTIVDAAVSRGWTIGQTEPGRVRATETWREHSATIDIRYTERDYSILYVASTNLKAEDGYIHRRYNSLVLSLEQEIDRRLSGAAH